MTNVLHEEQLTTFHRYYWRKKWMHSISDPPIPYATGIYVWVRVHCSRWAFSEYHKRILLALARLYIHAMLFYRGEHCIWYLVFALKFLGKHASSIYVPDTVFFQKLRYHSSLDSQRPKLTTNQVEKKQEIDHALRSKLASWPTSWSLMKWATLAEIKVQKLLVTYQKSICDLYHWRATFEQIGRASCRERVYVLV